MPLRLRLALVFTLSTAVVIAVAAMAFLSQLNSSLSAALDDTLRARVEAVTVRLAAAQPLAPPSRPADQHGEHQGEFAGSEDVRQVLAVDGTVLQSSQAAGSRSLLAAGQLSRAARGPVAFTTMIEADRVRLLAVPARSGGRRVIAMVGASTGITEQAQQRARTVILAAGPPAVALAGLGAWLLAGAALRPVGRMRRRLADITEHDTGARLRVPVSRDEVAALAEAMNALLDRLQRALEHQRAFVADAGHELRTPLTALKAELELADRPGRSRRALAAAVTAAAGDTDRLIRLAEDLLLLARADEGADFLRPRPIVLAEVAQDSVRAAASAADASGVTVALDADRRLSAIADPDRIRQAVDNLVGNALRHAPAGTGVEVTVHASARQPTAVIEVRDHGPGFPPGFLPHAFERFARADPGRARVGGGTGLGLAIVASIAGAHGGHAQAGNDPGGGARVRMEIPLVPPPSHAPEPSRRGSARSHRLHIPRRAR
ncbi:MAG: putative transrane sensory transduction histidine kinase for metal resistance [Streptosporangiaceae bacterium]|nr:putative transrane sensory transduction histidine kinase for metal resistance [Streptosporangiaceae bacterium]